MDKDDNLLEDPVDQKSDSEISEESSKDPSKNDTDPTGNENNSSETETDTDTAQIADDESVCRNCGKTPVVEGYSIPLCRECRSHYINYPIPRWIKVFATVVLAVMTYSLVSFPKSLEGGIAYERGNRAESQHMYMTAANQYEKVVNIFPNSFIGWGKLFVTRIKNNQFSEAEEAFSMIKGKESSNDDEVRIIEEANIAIDSLDYYYNVSEELNNLVSRQTNTPPEEFARELSDYTVRNPNDYLGQYLLGNMLFDAKSYEEAKSAYLKAIDLCPQVDEFHLGAAAAYRQTGNFDKALAECNLVLAENAEFVDAHASLAKIYLKQHKYDEALKSAQKAFELNNANPNAAGTLAVAYHYNNMTDDMSETLDILKGLDQDYYNRTKEITDGNSDLYD
ncbi:MAG TPA: tetratricopeptide repeat protein [Clostridia bacterium]|nr:tetratricopeptide repeat protein [Clostridia bacterium]